MALFNDIYDIAADGYGIITAAQAPAARPRRVQARALGAHVLQRLRRSRGARGRRDLPAWRARVRHARPGAGRPARNRGRDAEAGAPKGERTTSYEDIPSQRVADAIKSCGGSEMPARLLETTKQACGEGLVTAGEYEGLERELA
ncbi:hypothetical protein [Collinsella sp. AF08-23]|uniref:hypothetical protein n=1 Tax=Collinsella sp. AF08-23 TaxID=2292211 RepID=UPI000E4CB50D|nr:hypothetical protein [Collinsella sp. AF08-23]RHS39637.1 hypothetical protein DWV48_06055 [Collinsella sp. AF08-23]